MSSVEVEIAARKYVVACRDGEEEHLKSLAAIVDAKAEEAVQAVGTMAEARHLLFASLLLADELMEQRRGGPVAPGAADTSLAQALERLAERVEKLAERLEPNASNT